MRRRIAVNLLFLACAPPYHLSHETIRVFCYDGEILFADTISFNHHSKSDLYLYREVCCFAQGLQHPDVKPCVSNAHHDTHQPFFHRPCRRFGINRDITKAELTFLVTIVGCLENRNLVVWQFTFAAPVTFLFLGFIFFCHALYADILQFLL